MRKNTSCSGIRGIRGIRENLRLQERQDVAKNREARRPNTAAPVWRGLGETPDTWKAVPYYRFLDMICRPLGLRAEYGSASTERARSGMAARLRDFIQLHLGTDDYVRVRVATDQLVAGWRGCSAVNPRGHSLFFPPNVAHKLSRDPGAATMLLGQCVVHDNASDVDYVFDSIVLGDGTLGTLHTIGREAYDAWPDTEDAIPSSVVAFLLDHGVSSAGDLRMLLLREKPYFDQHPEDAQTFFAALEGTHG